MNQISIDISRRLDIIVRKGETFSKVIGVLNNNGTNFDFTDYSAELDVYTNSTDQTPQLIFNASGGLTLSSGEILLEKTASQLNLRRRDYIYFLWMTYPDNSIKLWLNGKFIINEGLFDGIEESSTLTITNDGVPVTIQMDNADSIDTSLFQLKAMPLNTFATSLLFDADEETFHTGGTHSFTLQSTGNINGVGKIVKLNTPVSASFSSDFILMEGSNATVSATKLNIIVMLFQDSYDGAGTNKVLYKIIQQTSV